MNPAAALRTVIGGSAIAFGFIALYCRDLPTEQASILLTAQGIGMFCNNVNNHFDKASGIWRRYSNTSCYNVYRFNHHSFLRIIKQKGE